MCISEQFCLYGEVVQVGVRLGLPLCPDHVVVGQPHCALMARAPMPCHQIEVIICAWVTFEWSLEAVLLGFQDVSPSIIEKILVSLKLLLLLFQAPCSGY